MEEKNNIVDYYSNTTIEEAKWNRLASAILMQSVFDFKKYAKFLKRAEKNKDESEMIRYLGELTQIAYFITSRWFTYLTNGNCPQVECLMELMKRVDKKYWEEILKDYVPIETIEKYKQKA